MTDEVDDEPLTGEEYALFLHANAICSKVEAGKAYKGFGWSKIKVGFHNAIDLIPGGKFYESEAKYPGLKKRLEQQHADYWGYPINIYSISEMGGMPGTLTGMYEDVVIGNKWLFILDRAGERMAAELPIEMKKINFFLEDFDDLEGTMACLWLIREQMSKAE